MFEFERREGESAAAAGSRCRKKRKKQIEVNSPSSAVQKLKWARTVHTSYEIGNEENHLASTQKWRKLLCSDESPKNVNLVKSEEVFKRRFPLLLDSFDKCAENPAQCSKNDAFSVYSKISGLLDSWEVQLLKENMVNTDGKDFWMIEKLEKKRDWVTNRLNLLTSVYQESLKFIKFTERHKKDINSKFKELSDVQNTFSSMATLLKFKDNELNEAKKQADEYLEELRKTQDSLREAHLKLNDKTPTNNPPQVNPQVMLDECLQDKETPWRQSESAVVDDFQYPGKQPIEDNRPSSVGVKKFRWNGTTVYPSDQISNGENQLASTQSLRKLLFNFVPLKNKLLVESERFFRNFVSDILYGIDTCAANPAQWSRESTNFLYNRIITLFDCWKEQLSRKNKHDWVTQDTNQLILTNLFSSVYQESLKFVTFSATQRETMDFKLKEISDLKNTFSSIKAPLKIKDQQQIEAKKQADDKAEKLKRSSFKVLPTTTPPTQVDPQVMLDQCLQEKEKQLNELKQQLDWGAKKQKETEAELKETREQLQSFVAKSREMTQTKQKDTIKKLTEIQTSLSMINPNYRPSCEIENESLSKEEKMFQDIKGLLQYTMQSVRSDNNRKKNTTESVLESDNSSASLRVSEYEMHLVTQIAAFLKVTPFPVSSHSIHSYVANIDNIVDLQFVESLLRKFPSFFKEVAVAPGSMDKNWIYLDLQPVITI